MYCMMWPMYFLSYLISCLYQKELYKFFGIQIILSDPVPVPVCTAQLIALLFSTVEGTVWWRHLLFVYLFSWKLQPGFAVRKFDVLAKKCKKSAHHHHQQQQQHDHRDQLFSKKRKTKLLFILIVFNSGTLTDGLTHRQLFSNSRAACKLPLTTTA